MAKIPEDWTDDMTVPLPAGRTVEELVDYVIQAAIRGTPDDTTEHALVATFGRSPEEAALARDRTLGGIVRATTKNPENGPARDKDPLAWTSYTVGASTLRWHGSSVNRHRSSVSYSSPMTVDRCPMTYANGCARHSFEE